LFNWHADYRVMTVRRALPALAVLLLFAASAQAATRQIIRGAGYGHGIGMSQYGAYGYARHGTSYEQILAHYYRGTTLSKASQSDIRVMLQSGSKTATLSGVSNAPGHHLDENATYKVRLSGLSGEDLLDSKGKRIDHYDGPLDISSANGIVKLGGRAMNGRSNGHYRGSLEFRPSPFGGMAVVNVLSLDDYVKGVVPGEVPSSWPVEALKAQAVAARSYALATDAGGPVFDQYPDTRSQVYTGADGEQARTNAAVSDTAGEVLRYGDAIAATYFFSTSGGETEDIQNVFYGAAPRPYLVGVKDPYDNLSPKHRWQIVMSKRSFVRKLGSLVKGRYKGIKVLQRGVSPRIVWAAVVGTKGTTRVRGATLEAKLGLFDTWASFNRFTGKVKPTPVTAPPISPGGGTPGTSTGVARPARAPKMGALLYGSIAPAPAKRKAVLQLQMASGEWRTVRRFQLRSGGVYRLKVSLPGTYRVVAGPLVGPSLSV
jgi:stage II sporulation protein D